MAANPVRNVAPFINKTFTVTGLFWEDRDGTPHRGVDIATGGNDPVYSILDGQVMSKGSDDSAGNWVIICDRRSIVDGEENPYFGYATRYIHLRDPVALQVNDLVAKGEQVGWEGETGAAQGIHLHVEMQNLRIHNWHWHVSNHKTDYLDPTEFMGIDNVLHTQWYYNGEPYVPTTLDEVRKKSKFKWVLYANKLRNKRKL